MEKKLISRKKRQNRKEKGTEIKGGKNGSLWSLNENLNTENCLNKD